MTDKLPPAHLAIAPPLARADQRVIDGPIKHGNEHRWRVELADGTAALIAQLLPEIADQPSVRRRYVYDAERVAALDAPAIAPTLSIGPEPDPRDTAAAPPWRMRVDPPGESLAAWLSRRAPVPVEEALALIADVADAVHSVHRAGGVLRDLEPSNVIIASADTSDDTDTCDDAAAGRRAIWLVDIGLARVDILSTRTASSLMLERSPYSAPEHLRATVLDQRADVYTLGALLWHALTGAPPFSDGPQLFRSSASLPALGDVVEVSDTLAAFVSGCLADDLNARPESARDVAEVLRGRERPSSVALKRITCQSCGEPMRPGLRLCLACGKQSVQFIHADAEIDDDARYSVILKKAKDDVEFIAALRTFFETVGEGPPPELNFLTGDARMYSKEERERLIKLPVPLFTNMTHATASQLAERLRAHGITVAVEATNKLERGYQRARTVITVSAVTGAVGVGTLFAGGFALGVILLGASAIGGILGMIRRSRNAPKNIKPPLARLRDTPAALPASDPLVARIASLLDLNALAADVHERVGELALLVQRVVDHRARLLDDTEAATLLEPIAPLVGLIEREVRGIATIDAALGDLDEGALVRAISASEVRGESTAQRDELLSGLDRLRAFEDARARHMQRLLEASSLMRRTVELGMATRDESADTDRGVAMALAALDHDLEA